MKSPLLIPGALCALSLPVFSQEHPPLFRVHSVDAKLEGGCAVAIADVDGDRKPDLVVAGKREVIWYRAPDWTKFVAARDLAPHDNIDVAARDLDGDGKCEVAVAGNWNPGETTDPTQSGSLHYLLPGTDRTQPWTAVALPHEPTLHRLEWARTQADHWSLLAQPLHGRGSDGTSDGVPASCFAYSFPADPSRPEQWERQLLDASLRLSSGMAVRRSMPGVESVVLAGKEGLMLNGHGPRFRLELDAAGFDQHPGAGAVCFGPSFTQRGRSLAFFTTIEPWEGTSLAVYRAVNGTDGGDGWERTVVDDALNQVTAVTCADLLGLGREQILAGWRAPDARGKTGINLYAWESGEWVSTAVDSGGLACEALEVADLNQDGRLDIAAVGGSTHNLVIYWNQVPAPPPPAMESSWKKRVLWSGGPCSSAVAADFSGDGVPDVAFTSGGRAHLVTGPDWKHRFLSAEAEKAGGSSCAAMDADGDGDLDLIDSPRQLCWFENPGKAPADPLAPWARRLIDHDSGDIQCVVPGDPNQDGKLDLIANQCSPLGPVADSLLWYERPSRPDAPWTRHVLANGDAPGGSHSLGVGDLDGDKLPDLAAGAQGDLFENGHWFAWWKNPGAGSEEKPWDKRLVATEQWRASHILPADIDKDGDNDLVATHGHGVGLLWFKNNKGNGTEWELSEIDPLIAHPHGLAVADLDGDGDPDAATCGSADRIVAWYENQGGATFLTHDIDHDQDAVEVRAVDLDGDGDLDLLVAGESSGNLVSYENPGR